MAKRNPTSVTPRYVCGPGDAQVILLLGDILGKTDDGAPQRTIWTVAEARALARALNTAANAVEGTEDPDE